MKFEVFHRGLLGRPDIIAVDMIHYSGLWGLCFSHHPPHNNHPRYAADTTTAGVLRFLEEAGWRHAFLPEEPTFPSRVPQHCIDHILMGAGVRCERGWVGTSEASDHLPIGVEVFAG